MIELIKSLKIRIDSIIDLFENAYLRLNMIPKGCRKGSTLPTIMLLLENVALRLNYTPLNEQKKKVAYFT